MWRVWAYLLMCVVGQAGLTSVRVRAVYWVCTRQLSVGSTSGQARYIRARVQLLRFQPGQESSSHPYSGGGDDRR